MNDFLVWDLTKAKKKVPHLSESQSWTLMLVTWGLPKLTSHTALRVHFSLIMHSKELATRQVDNSTLMQLWILRIFLFYQVLVSINFPMEEKPCLSHLHECLQIFGMKVILDNLLFLSIKFFIWIKGANTMTSWDLWRSQTKQLV